MASARGVIVSAYLTWKAGAVDVPPCSVCGRFDVAVREVVT